MSSTSFVLKPNDRSSPLNVVGIRINVLVSDTDSQSQRITLQTGEEGAGPPPHCHDWDESFYVTRGQLLFTCDGQTSVCEAGTLVHVPAGTVHAFSFGPGGGEMLEVTGAGSRAIEMFRALDREIPPGPVDVEKTIQVANGYGLIFRR